MLIKDNWLFLIIEYFKSVCHRNNILWRSDSDFGLGRILLRKLHNPWW